MSARELAPSTHVDQFTRQNLPPAQLWPEFVFGLPELQYPQRLNCVDALLDRHVREGRGERRCLLSLEETWSYAELQRRANQIAGVLVNDFGLVPGNRVLLRGFNSPWLAACWFGVLKAGCVAVATMPLLRSGELQPVGEMADLQLAISDHRRLEDLQAAQLPDVPILAFGGGQSGDLLERMERQPTQFESFATSADDVCMLAFTSGTTGRPKATMHFHRDVLAVCDTFSRHVLKPTSNDLFTGSPPLAFTFGLGGLLLFPLHAGAATLLLEQSGPEQLLEGIQRHRVTTLFTAPTAFRFLLGRLAEADLSSLRACVSAGETLPAATWNAWQRGTGIRIIDGLGSTEMLHIFIAETPERMRPGFTGRAIPGYQAEVQDEDGRPVPDGEMGRLAVKGPTGCRYLRGDRQTVYVKSGWNLTGDVYVRDADGYFNYRSRADDMIISAGYNIAGPEVEEALLQHPAVLEAAVVGVPDEQRGMIVKAFVVLGSTAGESESTIKELQDFVKSRIAPYKYPRQIELVSALPRTTTGKLQRFRLRQPGSSA